MLEGCRIFGRWTLGEGNRFLGLGLIAFLAQPKFFPKLRFFLSTVWPLCLPHHGESCPFGL